MSTKHPVERGDEEGRGFFDSLAERASNFMSSPAFFALCSLLVVAWIASYAAGWSTDVRAFLGETLAAVTLAIVALIKNAERRAEHAVQFKLDAIAAALLEMHRDGDEDDDDDEDDVEAIEDLERAIGRDEEV
jgi:low affinity Fe/Cu permease